MAIKRSSKIDSSFSASSMTDLIFLLLVFFVLATTLINPIQTLEVTLPTSDSEGAADSSVAAIEIVGESGKYSYRLNEGAKFDSIEELGAALDNFYAGQDMSSKESKVMHVTLYCDRDKTTVQSFVDVASMIQDMNKAYREEGNDDDKYKLVLATKESE